MPSKSDLAQSGNGDLERNAAAMNRARPNWAMLFYWQFALMLMSYAWATFVLTLGVHVCAPLGRMRSADEDGVKMKCFSSAGWEFADCACGED